MKAAAATTPIGETRATRYVPLVRKHVTLSRFVGTRDGARQAEAITARSPRTVVAPRSRP